MRKAGSEMRSPSCNAGYHCLCICLGLSVLGYELLGQELFACGSLYGAKSTANTSRFVAESEHHAEGHSDSFFPVDRDSSREGSKAPHDAVGVGPTYILYSSI